MRQLTLTATLEYYDVPQIITATDATGTRYLCTLYAHEADGYRYLGVQISEPRLMAFSTLISRMGWHASSRGKSLRKIAAL